MADLSQGMWNRALILNHISTTIMSIPTKLCRVVFYHQGLPPIKLHDPLITWSFEITWQTKNHYNFAIRVAMAIKLCRIVTYHDGFLPHKVAWPFHHVVLQDPVTNQVNSQESSFKNNCLFQIHLILINMLTQAYNFMIKRIPRGLNNFTRKNKRYGVSFPMLCIRRSVSRGYHSITIMNHEG